MAQQIDNLNFRVILDDVDFNQRINKDIAAAKNLNVQLSQLLQAKQKVNSISAQDAASLKRASDILAKQAIDQERIKKAAAQTALEEEKVRTQAARTTVELEKANAARKTAALNEQRIATEAERTKAAASNAALQQQRLATETERTKVATERAATATQNTANATARAQLAQRRLAQSADATTAAFKNQGLMMRQMMSYAIRYLGVFGAARLIGSIVRVTGEFELQKTTLATMIRDLSKAEEILGNIKKLAVASPFQFKELATYAKQLSAFSVPADELFQTTKMLADVSAGLGVDMNRLVLAFGQVKAAAFLRGQEVRQFTEAGIPILAELAKQFQIVEGRAVSTGEVFEKISARQVPFEMVLQVFKDLTSEGGKFFNMQEIQAETLRGKVSNLKDAYEMMLNEIGSSKSGFLKGTVDMLRSMMNHWEKIGSILKTIIVTYGVYKGVMLGVWAVEKLIAAGRMLRYFTILTQRVGMATAAMRTFGAASKANVIAGIAAAVVGLGVAMYEAYSNATALNRELEGIVDKELLNAESSIEGLDKLVSSLLGAKEGTIEYADIIRKINSQYGEHLTNLISEADAYDEVAAAAERAKESIRKKASASAREQAYQKIEEHRLELNQDYSEKELVQELQNALRGVGAEISDLSELKDVFGLLKKKIDEFGDIENLADSKGDRARLIRDVLQDYYEGKEFPVISLGGGLDDYLEEYAELIEKERGLDDLVNSKFDDAFYSEKERKKIEAVNALIDAEIKFVRMTEESEIAQTRIAELEEKRIYDLISAYEELGRIDMVNYYKARLPKDAEGWRKIVQDTLSGMGMNKGTSFGLWAEDTTVSVDYVEDMIKRYKELKDQIKLIPFDDAQMARLKKNKQAIEEVAKALGLNIEALTAGKKGRRVTEEEKNLKRRLNILRTLQDEYEELKEMGVSDANIKTLFRGAYPKLIEGEGEDFVTDLKYVERATKLIARLKALNANEAEQWEFKFQKDGFESVADGITKANTALEKYYKAIRKWKTEDFNLSGTGITLDLDKIVSDLTEKNNEIEAHARDLQETLSTINIGDEAQVSVLKDAFEKKFGEGSWDAFYKEFVVKGKDAIDELANKQKEYELKLAQEKINDLAKPFLQEAYSFEGIDLKEFGDKTYFQIRELKKKLQKLLNEEPLTIPMELQNALQGYGIDVNNLSNVDLQGVYDEFSKLGEPISDADQQLLNLIQRIHKAELSTEDFGNVVRKVMSGDLKKLTQEEGKALMDMVKTYLKDTEKLLSSISKYAELIGSDSLKGAMDGISQSLEILGGVADKLAKGDWIGAIISGVTSLTSVIFDALSAEERLNQSIQETRAEMALLASEREMLEGVDSVFGEDEYKKFTNAYDVAVKAHKKATEDIAKQNEKMKGGSSDDWGYGGLGGSIAGGAALGAAAGSIIPGIGTAVGALAGALVGIFVGTVGAAATHANNYAKSLQQMADEIGVDLINEDTGAYNVEALEAIKKTYSDLDSEYKKALDNMITNAQIYENAITEMATYMTDIFGKCADDMADSFINSFKESGQAALEYGELMSGLATDIAKSIIKSTLLQNVFNDKDAEAAAVKLAQGDAAGAMGIIDDAMQAAQDLTPYIQEFLESLKPYFDMGEMEGQNLGDGIKGITEDTANLLASYLNAIRADVSFGRVQWEQMNVHLQQIVALLGQNSSPILAEYQAQIAANTYNTAMNTQIIMEDLKSVITSEGGFTAIRTLS